MEYGDEEFIAWMADLICQQEEKHRQEEKEEEDDH